jgi:glutamate formiminotransferase / 5-formyltetrahydrofolate cyclo-ligase
MLLAVPNFSEGRDSRRIEEISGAFATGAALLDTHSDPLHNRTVATLSGAPGDVVTPLVNGAWSCVNWIDMGKHEGAHPAIGALDVCPVVWLTEDDRDAAREAALATAREIGSDLKVPVFLYGDLASNESRRERAFFRNGGLVELHRRVNGGELRPDFGPKKVHDKAGATLVTARPPLVAFNVELADADVLVARAVASRLRESGGGLVGVRAIGIDLGRGHSQVSTNVHDPGAVPLASLVERIRELAAPHGTYPEAGEIVGLVPERALDGWHDEIPLVGFDPAKHVIERRVRV